MTIQDLWYTKDPKAKLLYPLAGLFGLITKARKFLYQKKILKSYRSSKPVVVVGNISVGGNGKTPVVIYLIEELTKLGYKVGVVSRGYGGKASYYPFKLDQESLPGECGDEPYMIYKRCKCPVVVDPNRENALRLMEKLDVDLIISDDGLQRYSMERDYEIVVVDGQRRFGNGALLPAGPLREPIERLKSVDAIINNGGKQLKGEYAMILKPREVVKVSDFQSPYDEENKNVTALAGIGNPQRFFNTLTNQGFNIVETHPCSDHANYGQTSILAAVKDVSIPIVMTEKDAVKCQSFACKNWYFLPVDAIIAPEFLQHLIAKLDLKVKS